MRLATDKLRQLEESMSVYLTPEQRLIMLYWYGREPRHGWDTDDFLLGIEEVMRYYPDHRPQKQADMELSMRLIKERKNYLKTELSPSLIKERKNHTKREAAQYLEENTDITPAERKDLLDWIKSGESVRENPWLMTDEDGIPMDYLSAMRAADDLREHPKELPGVCEDESEPF